MADSRETQTQQEFDKDTARSLVFAPIVDAGLVQQVVRRLTEGIDLGLLEQGERLPPESELSAQLGIAPMTLREALAIMRGAGYIETRRGRGGGHFVVAPEPGSLAVNGQEATERIDADYVRDLNDYRRAIASHATALAAERASEADIDDLQRESEAVARATDYLEYLRRDAQFHIGIAIASGSERIWKEQTNIEMEVNAIALASNVRLPPKTISRLNGDHADVIDAIRRREPDRARGLVREHVEHAAAEMRKLVVEQ